MNRDLERGNQAVEKARQAFKKNDFRQARKWAAEAVYWAADLEEAWLWLAAVASPRASAAYLQRALEINPNSQAARRGMHWAIQRIRETKSLAPGKSFSGRDFLTQRPIRTEDLIVVRKPFWGTFLPLLGAVFILLAGLAALLGGTSFSLASAAKNLADTAPGLGNGGVPEALYRGSLLKETRTPTPTNTPTPTPTFTPTATFTPTPTDTLTPTPTDTPTPTFTPIPTDTPPPPVVQGYGQAFPGIPAGVGEDEPWIDINLSTQRAYAYVGNELIRSFIVSTGTSRTPTVTGQYRIYVKYRYADMAGPGYYLPDVPYVMYFYRGYGIHGTYWHNNFGTPMSHGCVNLTTEDAGWMFDFASVGTVVNVHY
jgi:lipoprotein-anchoring transpeptidase ErfK/SrfK